MSYKTGKSKSLEEITLDDVLQYPIWEWALGEEGNEEQDETWQRPIIDTRNVTGEMFNPTITIQIKELDLYGSAEYNIQTDTLSALSVWMDNEWTDFRVLKAVPLPLTIIALPAIKGEEKVEFICSDIGSDKAARKK